MGFMPCLCHWGTTIAKSWEEKDQEQGRRGAPNGQEATASFLTALAVVGATHAAFRSMLLREHGAAQTTWSPLSGAACRGRGAGARPAVQPSALVLRRPMGRAARGKLAVLHGSEGQHSNRLLKKKK